MQDTELFLSLAEIAGVFVGFGALIAVRGGSASGAVEVTGIRWVVSIAIWVVVIALAPVIISRYDLAGHELWLVCGLIALVLWFGVWAVNRRTPEMWETDKAYTRAQLAGQVAAYALLTVPMLAALIVVVLGLLPEQEPALYLTAVGLGLFLGALTLLFLVFAQRRPQTAFDPAELPATGGSSA